MWKIQLQDTQFLHIYNRLQDGQHKLHNGKSGWHPKPRHDIFCSWFLYLLKQNGIEVPSGIVSVDDCINEIEKLFAR